jgi:hypothetical protein
MAERDPELGKYDHRPGIPYISHVNPLPATTPDKEGEQVTHDPDVYAD